MHEFLRLDSEYPTRDPKVQAWVARRKSAHLAYTGGLDVRFFTCLAFCCFFVDDGGVVCFADQIYGSDGKPIIHLHVSRKGVTTRIPVKRSRMYFEAAMAIARRRGHDTPLDKQCQMAGVLIFLGIGIDLVKRKRLLSRDKRDSYSASSREVLDSTSRLPNGLVAYSHTDFDSLVHKLLHASEVVPLGRQHLFHCRDALKFPTELKWKAVVITSKARTELEWWVAQLAKSDDLGLPLASRMDFPIEGSPDHIIEYHDASREIDNVVTSGWGAWTVINYVFCYIVGRWTKEELLKHSINVLESQIRDMAVFTFVSHARTKGNSATHVTSFSDNTTAENNAEFGRPGTELLNLMLQHRQERAAAMGLHVANDRVASIDNDIADLLSRGDIYEALRFPRSTGMAVLELSVDPALRAIPQPQQ
jgi:hypothetical protein